MWWLFLTSSLDSALWLLMYLWKSRRSMLENSCRLSTPAQGTLISARQAHGERAQRRQHLPTYPKGSGSPWPQALGAMCTCPHLDSGQMNLVSVTSGPEGRPREVCFLFKP